MRRNNLALEVGIIPARAGFTLTEFNNSKSIGDHPRSRGVYNDFKSKVITAHGSSPLARGLQAQMAAQTAYNRIIPARAGFTPLWATPYESA